MKSFAAAVVAGLSLGTLPPLAVADTAVLSPSALAAWANAKSPDRPRCHSRVRGQDRFRAMCRFGPRSGERLFILADSHGTELSYALRARAKAENLRVTQITGSACPPANGFSPQVRELCAAFNADMLHALLRQRPATVLVALNSELWHKDPARAQYWTGLEETLIALKSAGHRVLLLGLVPTHTPGPLPETLSRLAGEGKDPEAYRYTLDGSIASGVRPALDAIIERTGVEHIPLMPALCGSAEPDTCRAMTDGVVHFFDGHHLSVPMAGKLLDEVILPAIRSGQVTPR
ncbi:MAG: SGNH hydrolase domain-containing protein [Pseudomonadota bacterium]